MGMRAALDDLRFEKLRLVADILEIRVSAWASRSTDRTAKPIAAPGYHRATRWRAGGRAGPDDEVARGCGVEAGFGIGAASTIRHALRGLERGDIGTLRAMPADRTRWRREEAACSSRPQVVLRNRGQGTALQRLCRQRPASARDRRYHPSGRGRPRRTGQPVVPISTNRPLSLDMIFDGLKNPRCRPCPTSEGSGLAAITGVVFRECRATISGADREHRIPPASYVLDKAAAPFMRMRLEFVMDEAMDSLAIRRPGRRDPAPVIIGRPITASDARKTIGQRISDDQGLFPPAGGFHNAGRTHSRVPRRSDRPGEAPWARGVHRRHRASGSNRICGGPTGVTTSWMASAAAGCARCAQPISPNATAEAGKPCGKGEAALQSGSTLVMIRKFVVAMCKTSKRRARLESSMGFLILGLVIFLRWARRHAVPGPAGKA